MAVKPLISSDSFSSKLTSSARPLYWTPFLAALPLVAVLVASLGCGGDRMPVAEVEGKVLYQGEPLEFGSVIFQPEQGPLAKGQIGPDGAFELSTYGDGDGAVIGTHKVRIACFESMAPDAPEPDPSKGEPTLGASLIPRRYTNLATSPLEIEVKADNEPLVIELTDE